MSNKARRDWYKASGEVVKDENDRKRIGRVIAGLDWQPFPGMLPIIAVDGIRATIKALDLPAPSKVSISEEQHPAVYGLECGYINGFLRLYVLDRMDYAKPGNRILIPLCGDWVPNVVGELVGGDL
jgi:hypothetical protein